MRCCSRVSAEARSSERRVMELEVASPQPVDRAQNVDPVSIGLRKRARTSSVMCRVGPGGHDGSPSGAWYRTALSISGWTPSSRDPPFIRPFLQPHSMRTGAEQEVARRSFDTRCRWTSFSECSASTGLFTSLSPLHI